MTDIKRKNGALFVLNPFDNPAAKSDKNNLKNSWDWLEIPRDWNPSNGLSAKSANTKAIIVFSEKYHEKASFEICTKIREHKDLNGIPILVAITMYQMPLGNSVKKLPNAGFIFTPIEEDILKNRLQEMTA